ncbi:MAG: helix-turn-helix transcriptional regulator [Lactobacillales bacterium]|nr:helix-turn-helix transcriptional regulator [Lactobacillales bacterium]
MNQERIGKFISELRKEKNLTQQELANKLGVTDKAISKWENGRCLMDISLLKPLSEVLEVSIVELINGEKIEKDNVYIKSDEVVENTLNYAEDKIKKNKIKIIISVIVSIVLIVSLGFLIYKSILLNKYNAEKPENYKQIISGLTLDKTIKIYKKTINEKDYLTVDDIKIRNDFSKFKKIEKINKMDSTKYVLYDENNKMKSAIFMGKTDTYIDMLASNSLVIMNNKDRGQFNDADMKYFLLRKDINNDLDFFKYVKENYYLENNLFTSIREMRENYAINTYVSIAFPLVSSTTIISGDYTGFIYNLKTNIKEAHIFRNGKSYVFTFMGEEFTKDSYIQDLLSTLEIK